MNTEKKNFLNKENVVREYPELYDESLKAGIDYMVTTKIVNSEDGTQKLFAVRVPIRDESNNR